MLHVTGIDLNPDSREEHLPGYTPNFPHIASLVQGARYFGGKASWHWHESVELFYVRKGAILYRTPHCEHVMRAGSGGMVNSNVLLSLERWQQDHLLFLQTSPLEILTQKLLRKL